MSFIVEPLKSYLRGKIEKKVFGKPQNNNDEEKFGLSFNLLDEEKIEKVSGVKFLLEKASSFGCEKKSRTVWDNPKRILFNIPR